MKDISRKKMGVEVKILSLLHRMVTIQSGPYIIHFIEDEFGNAQKMGFRLVRGLLHLQEILIPHRFFLPAETLANAIFRKQRKTKVKH